ncbi:hypothetical protein EXIGLDRAFT_829344 [Exidia glandulosa HHB12029]|uniref:Uncharacterized protein n=1 Tax=Exidia glandulosa HHB12029 TaxID=1314781 RepID=A0A165PPB1_EXIGL|nr:hypothetical protein EXIGLDRAFT_829344 [Exidia glandulosa HHB12029]
MAALPVLSGVRAQLSAVGGSLDVLDSLNLGASVLASMSDLAPAQAALHDSAQILDFLLARVRDWRNATTPVNQLSDELLATIFYFAHAACAEDSQWPKPAPTRTIFTLAHVCTKWRRVARDQAALWTDVQLPQTAELGLCQDIMGLSRGLALRLVIRWRHVPDAETDDDDDGGSPSPPSSGPECAVLPAVEAHMHRVTHLSLICSDFHADLIAKLLTLPAPRLTSLHIRHEPRAVRRPNFPASFRIDMPALKRLYLCGVYPKFLSGFVGTALEVYTVYNQWIISRLSKRCCNGSSPGLTARAMHGIPNRFRAFQALHCGCSRKPCIAPSALREIED